MTEGEKIATLEHIAGTPLSREVVDAADGVLYEIEGTVTTQVGDTDLRLMIDIIPGQYIKGVYHIEYEGEFIFTKYESKEITSDPEEEYELAKELANGLIAKEIPLTTGEKILRALTAGFYPPRKEVDTKNANVWAMRKAVREAHEEIEKYYYVALHH
jgi:hypothetical protein